MADIIQFTKSYLLRLFNEITCFGGMFFFLFLIAGSFALGDLEFSLKLALAFFATYFLTILIRLAYFRERPKKEIYSNFIEKLDSSSFPSLHSMRASAIFYLFYSAYGSGLVSLLFLGIALAVFASRYILKKHHISDILAGAIFGLVIAKLISGMALLQILSQYIL